MPEYEVSCPLGNCNTAVTIDETNAIYRVEGFYDDPNERFRMLERSPKGVHGGETFVNRTNVTREQHQCDEGHYLRVYITDYEYLQNDACLYGPAQSPFVKCPYCSFKFGTHSEFIEGVGLSEQNHHILRSVSKKKRRGHTETTTLTDRICTEEERVSKLRDCPNCGETVFFNYRSYGFDPDPNFRGVVKI